MSAERALFGAYREWYRLARAAHSAIRKQDWNFLLQCQQITGKLQSFIPNLAREARNEWKVLQLDSAAKENELRAVILDLMQLLESNKQLLCAARETALGRREKIGQVGRNLKRLHGSYVVAPPPGWTSFS
jgi:hypothetical protein